MLSVRGFITFFTTICFFQNTLHAQFTRFKHLTADDGLTNSIVYWITQDSKGFIWCATDDGINKYDGYKITRYPFKAKDSTGISAPEIRTVVADEDDKLWIGTHRGGLCCLDLLTNKFTSYQNDSTGKNSVSSDIVNAIIAWDKNTLVLGTSKGLNFFNKTTKTFKVLLHSEKDENSLLDNFVKYMAQDKEGNLWLVHPHAGVTKYNPATDKFTRYTPGNDNKHLSANDNFRGIFVDDDGLVWISLWTSGINVLDPKTGIFYSNVRDTSGIIKGAGGISLAFNITGDREGNIWFGTAESGICKYNKKTGEKTFFKNNPDDAESFGDNTAFYVFEDKAGMIWAGTWRNGLNYFKNKSLAFGHYKHEKNSGNTLSSNLVFSFGELPNNEVMIGTALSACIFNTEAKTFRPIPMGKTFGPSLMENSQVTNIAIDKNGNYWMTSGGSGVYCYDPKEKKYKNYSPVWKKFSHHSPRKTIVDHLNNVWVITPTEGLALYDRKKDEFEYLRNDASDPKSIPTNTLFTGAIDKNGTIFLGTGKKGLVAFDPVTKQFSNIYTQTTEKGSEGLSVFYIFIDSKGFIWAVTGEGMLKIDPASGKAEKMADKNPAFKNQINTLIEDNAGNKWMMYDEGLIKYNEKTNTATSFYVKDGLQGKIFNMGSVLKLKNGKLLFGGNNGFNFLDPEKIIEEKNPPMITLTGLQVLNKPYPLPREITYTNNITLSYRDYFFSLDFAAMDFANPSQNHFKYKLVGFNDDWVDIGTQHNITFTNLDPGNYTLNIKAANNNGIWNETPLELKITITPPFWRTIWFYVLCSLTGILCFYSFIKWREKKLIKEKAVLENKVNERTEELKEEKLKVEEAHKDIKDSILYAKRIQTAILSPPETLKNAFKESFILYQPKDVVSGDFYWTLHIDEKRSGKNIVAFAAADCTGHGVPGAFMSMLNSTLLNQTAYNTLIATPADALNFLNDELPKNLKSPDRSQSIKDGMDIAFCLIDLNKNELKFAGANNPCWIVRNKQLIELDPTKQAITASEEYEKKRFSDQTMQLEKNDCIYLFTDGYADQFGGPKGKKFKYKTLANLLIEINDLPMEEQHHQLAKSFTDWKGNLEQVDDVCIIGIRI